MSILSTSAVNTRHFDMEIAEALGDINAAVIVQQLNYWMSKEGVGVIIEGVKYVYNTFDDWVGSQFRWLSVWQFRKAMSLLRSLSIVKVIRYKAKQWNQTNYYSLDYERLAEFLKSQKAESIETVEMWSTTARDVRNPHLELRSSELSYKETENTAKKEATKQVAAASLKKPLEEENKPKQGNHHGEGLTASNGQKNIKSGDIKANIGGEKKVAYVEQIVNQKWKSHLQQLDSIGVPRNQTIIKLVKNYEEGAVESAMELLKVRKRDHHIPNPAGYFVQAVKKRWASRGIAVASSGLELESGDKGAIFRYWYDLARELGNCSAQEMRDGEQWVCMSGSWERWSDAVNRGYTVEYLKKVLKRYQGS